MRPIVIVASAIVMVALGCNQSDGRNRAVGSEVRADTIAKSTSSLENGPPEGVTSRAGVRCDTVSSPIGRITCLADAASESRELTICDRASQEGVRYQCYAVYAERRSDPDACFRIPDTEEDLVDLRDICLSDVAALVGRPELCQGVQAPGLRDSCYLKVHQSTGDTTLCQRIQDPGLKSTCTGEPVRVD